MFSSFASHATRRFPWSQSLRTACALLHPLQYYRGAEAAIIVYDITDFESFEGAKTWVKELKLYGQPNVVIALAANKCDMEEYRVVSTQEGQAYADAHEMSYFETSAKTNTNVRKMFVELAQCVPRKDALNDTTSLEAASSSKKGACC